VEARVFHLRTREDADMYSKALAAEVARFPGPSILCADHRPVTIYAPEVAVRLAELFSLMNTRLERAALLVAPSNATLILQLGRIVRDAKFGKRQVFREPEPALAHLSQGLDAEELARAATFLEEV
jgi:hypothetical protein